MSAASRVSEFKLYSLHSKADLKGRVVFSEVVEKALLHLVNVLPAMVFEKL